MKILGRILDFTLSIWFFYLAVLNVQSIIDGTANSSTAFFLILQLVVGIWSFTDAVHWHWGRK